MPEKDAIPDRKISESFSSSFKSFSDSLTALRDFVALIGTLLTERQRGIVREHTREMALLLVATNSISETPSLSEEEIARLKSVLGHEVAATKDEKGIHIAMPDKKQVRELRNLLKA